MAAVLFALKMAILYDITTYIAMPIFKMEFLSLIPTPPAKIILIIAVGIKGITQKVTALDKSHGIIKLNIIVPHK